jgi:hypothetical protein
VRSLSLENRNEEAFAAFNNQVYGRGGNGQPDQ